MEIYVKVGNIVLEERRERRGEERKGEREGRKGEVRRGRGERVRGAIVRCDGSVTGHVQLVIVLRVGEEQSSLCVRDVHI